MKITKKQTFRQILKACPASIEFFLEKGMHCIGCPMAAQETLEQGAVMHGFNPDEMVEELNDFLAKKSKKKNAK